MPDHYFSKMPESAHRPHECAFEYRGRGLTFETDAGVFSREGVDKGTALLLCALPDLSGDVLDMGCGWGAVGISVACANPGAYVTMADINIRAVELSQRNMRRNGVAARVLESDGFSSLGGEMFSYILTNPPIRAGKQVIYSLFAKSAEHLLPGGSLYLVIRKQQGAPSAISYLETVFAKTQVVMRGSGFFVIRADV
jgi:16S rRNA (guanine1207-N2)-methyltransferase